MPQIPGDEAPDARDVVEIDRLAVAHAEPGEDADDLAVALRRQDRRRPPEGLAVEPGEAGEVALGTVQVAKLAGTYGVGKLLNAKTGRSQLMGGLIWGMSSALLEATELDERYARYVNDNLADYLVPVNADVPSVEVIMLAEQDDHINPAGVKGIGELGNVGTNAAICNAIFHATGQRIRKLPVRLEQLEI